MKIEYRKGDLLAQTSGIIVHGCNCQGAMGSGVAALIRATYPKAYESYREYCEPYKDTRTAELLGRVHAVKVAPKLVIANAFTQDQYGTYQRQVDYDAIACVFETIWQWSAQPLEDTVIHIPKIGAGLGGGNWRIISTIIEESVVDDLKQIICWEL